MCETCLLSFGRVEQPETPEHVQPEHVCLPVLGFDAHRVVEGRLGLCVQSLPDVYLCKQEEGEEMRGIASDGLSQRARRVAHSAKEAPESPVEVVELGAVMLDNIGLVLGVRLPVRDNVLAVELVGHPKVIVV